MLSNYHKISIPAEELEDCDQPLNTISFTKIIMASPRYISIQNLVKKVKNLKIIVVGVTADTLLEESIRSNTQCVKTITKLKKENIQLNTQIYGTHTTEL